MKLLDVPAGRDFYITAIPEWKATCISHSLCGTRVQQHSAGRKVQITSSKTGETAEFESPGKPVLISSGTEVTIN